MKLFPHKNRVLAVGPASALIALSIVVGFGARAGDLPLLSSAGNGTFSSGTTPGTVGLWFCTGSSPLAVKSLGLLDWGVPGFAQAHAVGLWSETGSALARVDFYPGLQGYMDNAFRYQDLANPVILQPDSIYVLGAYYADGIGDRLLVNGPDTAESYSPPITSTGTRYSGPDPELTFPAYTVSGMSYGAANLRFQVIPEPTCFSFLLSAALATGLVRCRRWTLGASQRPSPSGPQ